MKRLYLILIMIMLVFAFSGCWKNKKKREILVLHAGSLSIPFKKMADAFEGKNPNVRVILESHGSRTCARQISDLKRRADVMASADSAVIRNLLMPEHASFCIDFTTNEMIIMYTEESKYVDQIHKDNWYNILLKPEVQYGHSDPNSDPCGYRAVLTWQLAEKYYQEPDLYDKLKGKMPRKNIRPKEVDLIALLEVGELDYIFIYRSVAQQHQMKFLVLPPEVNLKLQKFSNLYQTASVQITGKKPGDRIQKKGAPMVYGITLPLNAKNPELGIQFIDFVLGSEGQEIMKENGQPEIIPPKVDNFENLPEPLKIYFKKE
jgi:molybdate/tungstate transport system substrate-binding protein